MSFLVVAACLAVQWFLNFSSAPYQQNWVLHYVGWMRKQFSKLTEGHGLFGVVILVLPILIVVSILFTIVYHVVGHWGYSLLSLVLLWYCIDVTELKSMPANVTDVSVIFVSAYQKVFAILFWYFIFGPVGLTLYVAVHALCVYFVKAGTESAELQKYFVLTRGVMDWVPVRLLGLSFALAGNFGAVFKEWMGKLFQGIVADFNYVSACGSAAISPQGPQEAIALLQRTLLIWLVVMALARIGIWIG